ncbi:peptidase inhibitor family I36 protein [Streptomyces sp. 1222.5]|uniref:peptidase inhibitor family I36 protein n=1 Tax=Streptomyces sp. 1222.5 TaxID=1881026 RepID=UPI003EBD935D
MFFLRARPVLAGAAIVPLLVFIAPGNSTQAQASIIGSPWLLRLAEEGSCPTGYLCLYRDAELGGGGYGIREGRDLNDFRGINFNDDMSSWVNAASTDYCWYPDINFSGAARTMQPDSWDTVNLIEDNDIASSIENC